MPTRWLVVCLLILWPWTPVVAAANAAPADGTQAEAADDSRRLLARVLLSGVVVLFDDEIHGALHRAAAGTPLSEAMPWLTHLGDGGAGVLVTVRLARTDPARSEALARAMLTTGLVSTALKYAIGDARPYHRGACAGFRWDAGCMGMPSGHTATAFAIARVLGDAYPEQRATHQALAVLVGLSRILLDQHYPTQVLAGAFLGWWIGGRALEAVPARAP